MALLINSAHQAIAPQCAIYHAQNTQPASSLGKLIMDLSGHQQSCSLTNNHVYSISDWVYHKQSAPYTISFSNGLFESTSYSREKVSLNSAESSQQFCELMQELKDNKRTYFVTSNSDGNKYSYTLYFLQKGEIYKRPFDLTPKGPENNGASIFPSLKDFIDDSQRYLRRCEVV